MWSPLSYKRKGLEIGRAEELLDNAIEQTENVIEENPDLPSILTLNHLSTRTKTSLETLKAYISRDEPDAYRKFSIAKRSGGRRFIRVPAPQLANVQKWIHHHILSHISPHRASYGFRKRTSIKDCAGKHCGARWLIKLDIVNFFETISEIQVFSVFQKLGYQPLVAFELARLCTVSSDEYSPRRNYGNWWAFKSYKVIRNYEQKLLGYLPQGASSSPMLSNLVMWKCDEQISKIAKKNGMKYSRYSDDIALSTSSKDFNRDLAKQVIQEVNRVLSQYGYLPHFKKCKVVPPGARKVILGLNVDGAVPVLQRETKDRIRQHLYFLKKYGPIEHALARGFDSVWGLQSHLRGLIDYAKAIEPEYAAKRLREFREIDWPF